MPISRTAGIALATNSGIAARTAPSPQTLSNTPSPPPSPARSSASVSSCRNSRVRPAPSAPRIAISRALAEARASSRLATLAQTISSTTATTAINSMSGGNSWSASICCIGVTRSPTPVLVFGYAASRRW